jgi:DNA-binding transcriptional ArsR family regulator
VADRDEGPEKDSRSRVEMIGAIGHPLRRRILRLLRDLDEPRSPSEVSRELGEPLGTGAYHVRVLERTGAVEKTDEQQVRGAVESFFVSTIEDDPPIEALLEETREADEEAG